MREFLKKAIKNSFPKKKVVIVGDLVADQFLHGTIDRVSREAPVFILRHEKTITLAGGAANAAVNVASLGGHVAIVGLVGKDKNAEELIRCLQESNVDCCGVLTLDNFQTTTKVRVLASRHYATRQQVLRIDYENDTLLDEKIQHKLMEKFLVASQEADAVVISDYGYGVASTKLVEAIKEIALEKQIPILADSRHRLREFIGVTSATPNQEEVEELVGKKLKENDELVSNCIRILELLNTQALLVTRGNKGMLLIERGKPPLFLDAVGSKEPVDVTGAGDTVIAAYALSLASGLNFAQAAFVSNHAGGIVVMKKGTASVSADELIESLSKQEDEIIFKLIENVWEEE
jgi:rfaE bifunctional protein kinase chain/domain